MHLRLFSERRGNIILGDTDMKHGCMIFCIWGWVHSSKVIIKPPCVNRPLSSSLWPCWDKRLALPRCMTWSFSHRMSAKYVQDWILNLVWQGQKNLEYRKVKKRKRNSFLSFYIGLSLAKFSMQFLQGFFCKYLYSSTFSAWRVTENFSKYFFTKYIVNIFLEI